MPRGQITKDIIKCEVLKLKNQLYSDGSRSSNPKDIANKYLNKVLNKIEEYRY